MAGEADGPRGTLTLHTIAMPKDTNANGDIFGGWLMAQSDLACPVLGRGCARGRVATVAVEAMSFHRPVPVGDVGSIHAVPEREGRTSMKIAAEVGVTRQPKGRRFRVTEDRCVFVGVDADGVKRPLPEREAAR